MRRSRLDQLQFDEACTQGESGHGRGPRQRIAEQASPIYSRKNVRQLERLQGDDEQAEVGRRNRSRSTGRPRPAKQAHA